MKENVVLCCTRCLGEIDLTQIHYSGEGGKAICPKCAGKDTEVETTLEKKEPPTSNVVAIQVNPRGIIGLQPGEKNELYTRQLVRDIHRNFLKIGKLLTENRNNAYWSTAGNWGSFSDYVESLGISKSAAYMMIRVSEVQLIGKLKLSEEEILEIGIAKMGLLVSANKADDADIIALARDCPVRDLREHLGHKAIMNDSNHNIICPHCLVVIMGAKWVRLTT